VSFVSKDALIEDKMGESGNETTMGRLSPLERTGGPFHPSHLPLQGSRYGVGKEGAGCVEGRIACDSSNQSAYIKRSTTLSIQTCDVSISNDNDVVNNDVTISSDVLTEYDTAVLTRDRGVTADSCVTQCNKTVSHSVRGLDHLGLQVPWSADTSTTGSRDKDHLGLQVPSSADTSTTGSRDKDHLGLQVPSSANTSTIVSMSARAKRFSIANLIESF